MENRQRAHGTDDRCALEDRERNLLVYERAFEAAAQLCAPEGRADW